MQSRKEFLRTISSGALLASLGQFPFSAFASTNDSDLVLLHTNDVHSRLEPFPNDGSKLAGLGGIEARQIAISKLRQEFGNILLLDAGDIFQGTPYFNLYKGEPEIKAMSMLGYDAATMGNHDFDAGLDGFAKQLVHANFPFVTTNYDFTETILEGKTKPYHIIQKGKFKIGIIGLGIKLKGLVPDDAFGKTKYLEPIQTANATALKLKKKHGCHMIVCLSHLGYEYDGYKVSDLILAKESEHIDVIIGGHTHTFLDNPTRIKNKLGKDVIINQAGWAGVQLGKLVYQFAKENQSKLLSAHTVVLSKQKIG